MIPVMPPLTDPFAHIIGHAVAKRALMRAIENPRYGYLFLGPDGVGVHPLAEAFVHALAHHPIDRSFASHPDIIVLERGVSDSGKLKKEIPSEIVRGIRVRVSEHPTISPRVVAYVKDADYLNEEGVNSLLKCVEEPVAGAVFVFVAHALSSIPETLQSRLVRIDLGHVSSLEIDEWLQKNGVGESDRKFASTFAYGRPGYAWSIVHDEGFRASVQDAERVIDGLMSATRLGDALVAIADDASFCESSEDSVTEWRKALQCWQMVLRGRFSQNPLRASAIASVFISAERELGGSVPVRLWLELGFERMLRGAEPAFPSFVKEFDA